MVWAILVTLLLTSVGWIIFFCVIEDTQSKRLAKANESLHEQMQKMRQQINIAVIRTPVCKCEKPATHKYEHHGQTFYACTTCLPSQLENV